MQPSVDISKRLVLINTASGAMTHALNISVLLWVHQHLLRRISAEEYAIFPVVIAVMMFVPVLSSVLSGGLGRYAIEAYARGDEKRITQIVSTMFPLLATCGIVVLVIGAAIIWQVDRVLNIPPARIHDARLMLGLLIASSALRLSIEPFTMGIQIRQKFIWADFIQLSASALRLTILLSLLYGVSTRILWVVVASVSTDLLASAARVIVTRRLVPAIRLRLSAFRWDLARELTSFGIWNTIGQVAGMARRASQPLILMWFATPLDVACFHIGSLAVTQIQQAVMMWVRPLRPQVIAMHAMGDKNALRSIYLRGGRCLLWLIMLLVLPLIIYHDELMALYLNEKYAQYKTAATVMALLLAAVPIRLSNIMMPILATATARVRPLALLKLTNQLAAIGLMLYLVGVHDLGAIGAALAVLVITAITQPAWMWPLGWRLADVSAGRWLREAVLPGVLPGAIACVGWIGMKIAVSPDTWLTLGVCAVAGLLVYVLVLLKFCLLPPDQLDLHMARQAVWKRWRSMFSPE